MSNNKIPRTILNGFVMAEIRPEWVNTDLYGKYQSSELLEWVKAIEPLIGEAQYHRSRILKDTSESERQEFDRWRGTLHGAKVNILDHLYQTGEFGRDGAGGLTSDDRIGSNLPLADGALELLLVELVQGYRDGITARDIRRIARRRNSNWTYAEINRTLRVLEESEFIELRRIPQPNGRGGRPWSRYFYLEDGELTQEEKQTEDLIESLKNAGRSLVVPAPADPQQDFFQALMEGRVITQRSNSLEEGILGYGLGFRPFTRIRVLSREILKELEEIPKDSAE